MNPAQFACLACLAREAKSLRTASFACVVLPPIDVAQCRSVGDFAAAQICHTGGERLIRRPGHALEGTKPAWRSFLPHEPVAAVLRWSEYGIRTSEPFERARDMCSADRGNIAANDDDRPRRQPIEHRLHPRAEIAVSLRDAREVGEERPARFRQRNIRCDGEIGAPTRVGAKAHDRMRQDRAVEADSGDIADVTGKTALHSTRDGALRHDDETGSK